VHLVHHGDLHDPATDPAEPIGSDGVVEDLQTSRRPRLILRW
jgi:hypothetical protein